MDDYYLVLGVEQDAKPEAIQEKFRFLAQAYHPDKFSSPKQKELAEEEFKRINNAYQILSNPLKRADYDIQRKRAANYSRTNTNDVNRKTEEAARQRAQDEQKKKEETARQQAQEEGARQRAQEERNRKAGEEAARQRAQEEQARKMAQEAARQQRAEEDNRESPRWRVVGLVILGLLFIVLSSLFAIKNIPSSTGNEMKSTAIASEGPNLTSNQLRIQQTAEISTTPIPFLVDNFSNEKTNSNWQQSIIYTDSPQSEVAAPAVISDGKAIINASADMVFLYTPVNYSDVIIQVDITNNSGVGIGGLFCRYQDAETQPNVYYFGIRENEFIFNNIYNNDSGTTLLEGAYLYDYLDSLLSEKSSDTLTVKCQGNAFSAYVNGTLVAFVEVKNQLVSSGYVGVFVTSLEDSEFSFDNFSISKP